MTDDLKRDRQQSALRGRPQERAAVFGNSRSNGSCGRGSEAPTGKGDASVPLHWASGRSATISLPLLGDCGCQRTPSKQPIRCVGCAHKGYRPTISIQKEMTHGCPNDNDRLVVGRERLACWGGEARIGSRRHIPHSVGVKKKVHERNCRAVRRAKGWQRPELRDLPASQLYAEIERRSVYVGGELGSSNVQHAHQFAVIGCRQN